MKYKACPAFKADRTGEDGSFEAIVSVFGNVDRVGDVVMPGAFAETLQKWAASGDPIPVLWSHNMSDPRYGIGVVKDAAELSPGDARVPEWVDPFVREHGGLWVAGQLDVGEDASDVAVAGRKLLRQRRVKQFSYAYDVLDGGWGVVDGEDAYELRKLDLFEISPTPVGANDLTQLLGAKASALVANMAKGDDPTSVARLLAEMSEEEIRDTLAVFAKALTDRREGTPTNGPVKRDDRDGGKRNEPNTNGDAIRLMTDLLEAELAVTT